LRAHVPTNLRPCCTAIVISLLCPLEYTARASSDSAFDATDYGNSGGPSHGTNSGTHVAANFNRSIPRCSAIAIALFGSLDRTNRAPGHFALDATNHGASGTPSDGTNLSTDVATNFHRAPIGCRHARRVFPSIHPARQATGHCLGAHLRANLHPRCTAIVGSLLRSLECTTRASRHYALEATNDRTSGGPGNVTHSGTHVAANFHRTCPRCSAIAIALFGPLDCAKRASGHLALDATNHRTSGTASDGTNSSTHISADSSRIVHPARLNCLRRLVFHAVPDLLNVDAASASIDAPPRAILTDARVCRVSTGTRTTRHTILVSISAYGYATDRDT
jgi:hypothetical protein